MEDYGLNEAISYANLMIILFVCINLIHFLCSRQIFLPSNDSEELSVNNKNNIRTNNEKERRQRHSGDCMHYPSPLYGPLHRDYLWFQRA